MALQHFFGFDGWDTTTLRRRFSTTVSGSYPLIDPTGGPDSDACLELNNGADVTLTVTQRDEYVIGFLFYMGTLPTVNSRILELSEAGSAQISLRLNTNGTLTFQRSTSTVLATSSTALVAGEWNWVVLHVKIGNGTDGFGYLYLNGAASPDLAITNVDTQQTAFSYAQTLTLTGANSTGVERVKNLVVMDNQGAAPWNAPIGQPRTTSLLPTSDVTTDLTPSSGSTHYVLVDDATPDDDTTTVSGASGTEAFGHDGLTYTPDTIYGVKVECVAKKDDVATRTITPTVVIDGVTYFGDDITLTTNYAVIDYVWQVNPATSTAWTKAVVDAADFGFEVA